jgi:hypothetical protein
MKRKIPEILNEMAEITDQMADLSMQLAVLDRAVSSSKKYDGSWFHYWKKERELRDEAQRTRDDSEYFSVLFPHLDPVEVKSLPTYTKEIHCDALRENKLYEFSDVSSEGN